MLFDQKISIKSSGHATSTSQLIKNQYLCESFVTVSESDCIAVPINTSWKLILLLTQQFKLLFISKMGLKHFYFLFAYSSLAVAHLDSSFFEAMFHCLSEAKHYSLNVMMSNTQKDDSDFISHGELLDTLKWKFVGFLER